MQQAVALLMQETVETFVGLYTRTIAEQAARLEEFTRMAAHEWRQPLGTLRTAAALLRVPELGAEQRDTTVAMIERNISRLVDMTMTLERIARIDGVSDNPIVQEVDLSVVAGEAARQLREMAQANDVVIRIADDMPTLQVDVGRLELTLVNLLSNAIKYADPAKPERQVSIAAHARDGHVEMAVHDNGMGIPAARLPLIFRRFTRAHADDDRATHVSGVGLGLSIVADCIKEMGGRIDVQSQEGEGTVFRVMLPRDKQPLPSEAMFVPLV